MPLVRKKTPHGNPRTKHALSTPRRNTVAICRRRTKAPHRLPDFGARSVLILVHPRDAERLAEQRLQSVDAMLGAAATWKGDVVTIDRKGITSPAHARLHRLWRKAKARLTSDRTIDSLERAAASVMLFFPLAKFTVWSYSSVGGTSEEAMRIAAYLATLMDPDDVRVVQTAFAATALAG